MTEKESFAEGYEKAIKKVVPEDVLDEAKGIVETHKPASPELADFKPVALKINPKDYIGRDLRTLSKKEIKAIEDTYPDLKKTDLGYQLGQNVMALEMARVEARYGTKGFSQRLKDDEAWIFKPGEEKG